MDYTLKSGKKLTDEDIKYLSEAVENGDLDVLGQAGKSIVDRPRVSSESQKHIVIPSHERRHSR